jgi:hypothetical protein
MNTEFDQELDLLNETLSTPAQGSESSASSSASSSTSSASVSFSNEPFRMRCPNCKKLYSVEAHHLDSDDLTKFECVSCQTSFFAMRPMLHGAHFLETRELETQFAPLSPSLPGIDGFEEEPVEAPFGSARELERTVRSGVVQAPIVESRECPNCHTRNALSNSECTKCGIVFAQFQPGLEARIANDIEFSESAELTLMWQGVQDDYQNISKHEAFVAKCAADEALVFAAHKYAQILVAAPVESIARQMRSRIQGMAAYGFDARDNGLGWQTWSFPLPSFNSFIIMLGTILVVVGFGFPNTRHTAGLGFAMIALAVGMRVFLRRPRD